MGVATNSALPPGIAPRGAGDSTAPAKDELSRGLRWSLIAHGGVFLLIAVKALVFPGQPIPFIPSLRVDIVGLPDILKKDLSQIPKTQAPPDGAEAPKKTEPLPPPAALPKAKTPPKETAEPDEMVLKPAKQEQAREKKMKSALDRIKALERISDDVNAENKPPAKTSGMVVKGNKVSKGTSLSPDAKESAEASYFDGVRDKLQSNWALPVWLARQRLDAQILIRIDATGQVSGFKFMKSSGNAQFDQAVRNTVQQSLPFAPPPADIADSVDSHGVLIGFPL